MLRAAIEGIKARGQAELGDKTLLDALVPVTDALEAEPRAGAQRAPKPVAAMAVTARNAADATKTMQARRGRASYTGERSIGSLGRRRDGDGRHRSSASPTTGRRASTPSAPSHDYSARHTQPTRTGSTTKWRKPMKKFVNDPKQFVPEMLQGHRPGQPGHAASTCPSTT